MENPLVSVVTPTYNHARYIGRCIDSLLGQTYPYWEMIVVDDGSTDKTRDVVQSYRDHRITYISQQNQGVAKLASTINLGLRKTSGELVTMLASDDTWPPYRLEKQVPIFQDPRVVLCYGRGFLIDENDKILGEVRLPSGLTNLENRPVGSILYHLFLSSFIFQPSVLLRRRALDKLGGYIQPEGLLAEDYPTHMALALIGEFRYLDLPLGNYRMHSGQMTRNHYLAMVETDIPYVLEFFRSLDIETRKLTRWTEESLQKQLSIRLCNSYLTVGRRALLAKSWKDARGGFVTAFRRGAPKTKAKAMIGILCSYLHVDLERLARLTGLTPLRPV